VATARMPDAFYDLVAHHLPPEQPVGHHGGRPRIGHRVVVRVIWFVLASGTRWEDVPPELGCSGRTAHRRLRAWEEAGIWDRLHADLLRLLRQAGKLDTDLVIVDGVYVRAFGGGEQTGPSPVDRRKLGTKHTLLVSRRGYDSDSTRWLLTWLGIEPRITRRKTPHGSGLGRVRWVVERTISWLKGLRRMRVRYDRLGVIRDAWTTLAASVICFRILAHDVI
jgi:transposase